MDNLDFYTLRQYAEAEDRYKALLKYQEEYYESLYDKIRPSKTIYDEKLGRIFLSGQSTEYMALEIIAEKAVYQKKIDRSKKQMDWFNEALQSISKEEHEIITDYYNDKPIPKKQMKKVRKIESKLLHYIKNKQEEERKKKLLLKVQIAKNGSYLC